MVAALLATACGSGSTSVPSRQFDVPETVALGQLPEPLTTTSPLPSPPTTPPASPVPPTTAVSVPVEGAIADSVVGYRLLLIGDTVLAAIAPRNGGLVCDVLTGFGWTVEVAAEPGRFVGFADEVLDERLQPTGQEEWDVVAVMLGNQFDGDLEAYTRALEGTLDRLSPRPTILYTLSEVNDDAVAINEVIRALPRSRPNVVVVDWAEVTVLDPDQVFDDDGPELTPQGGELLVLHTAAALGKTPKAELGEVGECLPSVFVDDTAIVL